MIGDCGNMTVILRSLMENPQTKTALENALSTYPLYAGKKDYVLIPTREALNEKILNHYKYREIGFETVGRFLDELQIAMCEIMPYYNELFKTVEIMADLENPFDNVDVTETFEEQRTESTSNEGTATNTQSATGKQTATGTHESETTGTRSDSTTGTSSEETNANGTKTLNNDKRVSDTPQNSIDNINNYLTEHVKDSGTETTKNGTTSTGNNSTTSEGNESTTLESEERTTTDTTSNSNGTATTEASSEMSGTTRHTFTKKGNQGVNTYAHDMNEFRTSIIDVVDRIIHDKRIAELFMLVW